MNAASPRSATEDRRAAEAMRRGMLRTTTAMALILAAVLGLAFAAVVTGVRAMHHLRQAETAEHQRREQLWGSYLEQARATRLSGVAGSRQRSLDAIRQAAAFRPSLELRNEAIACLSLADLEEETKPRGSSPGDVRGFDLSPDLQSFVRVFRTGKSEVCRLGDDTITATFDPAAAGLGTNRIATWAEFNPRGEQLAIGFLDGTVVLWALPARQPVAARIPRRDHGRLTTPAFSPDGQWLAIRNLDLSGGDGLTLVECATGSTRDLPGVAPYQACAVAPGQPLVALGVGSSVRLIDTTSGEVRRTLDHPAAIGGLAWSHNGRRLAAACTQGDVFLWDFEPEHFHVLSGHTEFVGTLRFSPDDRWLLTAGRDGSTRLWDTELGQALLRATGGEGLRFNSDGTRIGFQRGLEGVGVWRTLRPDSVRTLPLRAAGGDPNQPFDLSPDGRWLAALVPDGIQWWNLEHHGAGRLDPFPPDARPRRSGAWSVTCHPTQSRLLVCQQGRIEEWELLVDPTGQPSGLRPGRPVALPPGAEAHQATLGADGRTVLVEFWNREIAVLDLEGERPPLTLEGQARLFYPSQAGSPTGSGRLAVSPDGRWVAAGKDFGPRPGPTVWDTRSGRIVASLDGGGLAAFSPDGAWLGASAPSRFLTFRAGDWSRVRTKEQPGLGNYAGFFAWTPAARGLVASHDRQSVEWFDGETGASQALLAMPLGHSASAIRLSRDAERLVVASPRNLLVVWDLQRLRGELAALRLDWGEAEPTLAGATPVGVRSGSWLSPFVLVVFGLGSVAIAAALAAWMLRRHRAVILQHFHSEALARQRNRELESARIELMHGQKMQALGTLAAGIAHDFNNLLSVIRMSNQFIGRATPGDSEIREHVQDIEQAVRQGQAVVRSMLGYARENAEPAEALDLGAIIEDTVSMLSKEFLHGIRLTLELERDLPRVEIGRGRLAQVLLNLIVNAAEAMKGEGTLTLAAHRRPEPAPVPPILRARPAGTYVEVIVRDSGPGIPHTIRERIFDPFFTTKTGGIREGTGLGLSMVYTVADQHRLGLSVESADGQGTTFRITIPVGPPEPDRANPADPPPPAAPSGPSGIR